MKVLSLVISILLTAFVFSMSLQSGDVSSGLSEALSQNLFDVFRTLFPDTGIQFDDFHIYIRKLAHVCEYATLGLAWTITFRSFRISPLYVLLLGILIASLDESLQLLVPNRGPSIIDAMVFDFGGFLIGHFLFRTIIPYKK